MIHAITGLGILCSIGKNRGEVVQALIDGRDGIGEITRFPTGIFTAHKAAMLPQAEWDLLSARFPDLDRRTAMALTAARDALTDAKIDPKSERTGFVYGICVGGKHGDDEAPEQTLLRNRLQNQAAAIVQRLNISGPSLVVSSACASSAHALGVARNLLRFGKVDKVLVGGAGDVAPEMFAGFHALGVMSPEPCAPFSFPVGLNLGEGAAFFVIENVVAQPDIQKPVMAFLAGYGSSLDAYHPTTPDPTGSGIARALACAIADAGVPADKISYVNVHGTGTAENDKGEWLGIKAALGSHALSIPLSSSKSFLGHTGGAAGIIEAAVTVLSMNRQVVPPTLHIGRLRKLAPPDPVNALSARPYSYSIAATCNSAFGGANAAVILTRSNDCVPARPVQFSPVEIAGTGVILPKQADPNLFLDAASHLPFCGKNISPALPWSLKDIDFSKFTHGRDERFLDPVTRYLAAAAATALKNTLFLPDEDRSTRRGLITGAAHVPSESLSEFEESRLKRGLDGISAHAFSRIVMNAATGAVAELLRLKGPTATIASGEGAGLVALMHACMELAGDPALEFILAAAADELGSIPLRLHTMAGRTTVPSEAGAAVVLKPFCRSDAPCRIVVSGIGIAGPGELDQALKQTLHDSPGPVDCIISAGDGSDATRRLELSGIKKVTQLIGTPELIYIVDGLGYSEATTALVGVEIACKKIRTLDNSRCKRIIIVAVSGINCSCSVLIEKV